MVSLPSSRPFPCCASGKDPQLQPPAASMGSPELLCSTRVSSRLFTLRAQFCPSGHFSSSFPGFLWPLGAVPAVETVVFRHEELAGTCSWLPMWGWHIPAASQQVQLQDSQGFLQLGDSLSMCDLRAV